MTEYNDDYLDDPYYDEFNGDDDFDYECEEDYMVGDAEDMYEKHVDQVQTEVLRDYMMRRGANFSYGADREEHQVGTLNFETKLALEDGPPRKYIPWPPSFRSAPFLAKNYADGNSDEGACRTIHDVPTSSLENGMELALVVPLDRLNRKIRLATPNPMGWSHHFTCVIAASLQQTAIEHKVTVDSWRPRGTVLFSFGDRLQRVAVFEAAVRNAPGAWTDWDEVPYGELQSDEEVWLPRVLEEGGNEFEGHFVFDSEERLLAHNCKRLS